MCQMNHIALCRAVPNRAQNLSGTLGVLVSLRALKLLAAVLADC